ncbi:acyl carrier protein [Viridibacterium curvum]|uniref:Phosphopantetheine-binding protein n=1 Tax=Viridibacterium curvum TaxID=1101404 RepID=A0ABP9R1S6_9RHOO
MIDELTSLREALRVLVLDASEKSEPEGGLAPDEILFSSESRLQLDSLDALQISMAIQKRFGIRITDSKETRRALATLQDMAEYLHTKGARVP